MIRRFFLLLSAFLLFSPVFAGAQDIPVPGDKAAVLSRPDAQLDASRTRQQALKQELDRIGEEMEDFRTAAIKAARDIKKGEKAMTDLEDQVEGLEVRRTEIQKKLKKDHKQMDRMVSALIRLRRTPPEALLARPGGPVETAQTALILKDILTPLHLHALQLRQNLDELARIEMDLSTRQAALKDESKKVLAEQARLQDLIKKREKAYAALANDIREQDSEIRHLAQLARDFRDLIRRLDDRDREIAAAPPPVPPRMPDYRQNERGSLPPPPAHQRASAASQARLLRSLGDIQMPVAGIVRIRFGEPDEIGSDSQGLQIQARAGAVVVAPMNGIVRYRGKFKNFGNLVILEHAKNYHSLVAGLTKIDTVVGQSVSAGEPLGNLGTNRSARPVLYYELRRNGKPINPARIFADLG